MDASYGFRVTGLIQLVTRNSDYARLPCIRQTLIYLSLPNHPILKKPIFVPILEMYFHSFVSPQDILPNLTIAN